MASIGQTTPCLIIVQDTKLYSGNMSKTPVTYVCVCVTLCVLQGVCGLRLGLRCLSRSSR